MEITNHDFTIRSWCKEKLEKLSVPLIKDSSDIFHYTSQKSMESILSSNSLWFSSIHTMEDKQELIAGYHSIVRYYELKFNITKEEIASKSLPVLTNVQDAEGIEEQNFFICSFSYCGHNDYLWQNYANSNSNPGVCIHLKYDKLLKSILTLNPELEGCNLYYGYVDYKTSDGLSMYSSQSGQNIKVSIEMSLRELFYTLFKDVIDKNGGMPESKHCLESSIKYLPVCYYNGELSSFQFCGGFESVYFIKNSSFSKEQEFRIVIGIPKSKVEEKRKSGFIKERNNKTIPYIELKFNPDDIVGITYR